MEADHRDSNLERLEFDADFTAGLDQGLVKRFRKVMQQIRAAADERDLRNLASPRFKRLKGKRKHEYSMRLNDQWRLIVELRGKAPKKRFVVKGIEDYH